MVRTRKAVAFVLFLLMVLFSANLFAGNSVVGNVSMAAVSKGVAGLRMPFIVNQGQVDERVLFYADTFGGTVFVTKEGAVVYSFPAVGIGRQSGNPSGSKPGTLCAIPSKPVYLKEELIGGKVAGIKGLEESAAKVSYYKGNDPLKWKNSIPTYTCVSFGEVYNGIEMRIKAHGNTVEKLFYVNVSGKPEDIRLSLTGNKFFKINRAGELVVKTGLGDVRFSRPVAYQEIDGKRVGVRVDYCVQVSGLEGMESKGADENSKPEIRNSKLTYGFRVASYDKTKELVIDPLLASTFLGGSSGDICRSLARDADGNIYVVGETDSSDFPVTSGAYSSTGAKTDMFVSKLSADLMTLLESTVFGGSDDDVATGVAVNRSGEVCVTGVTRSKDFPMVGSYNASFNGGESDIVIAKLSGDLAKLLASTYLGGSGKDYAHSIKIAPDQSVVVAGYTFSEGFPTSKSAYDRSYNGYADGIVSILSKDLGKLVASTYLGGQGGDSIGGYSSDDFGDALAIDAKGYIYVGGATGSLDFPVTPDAYDHTPMVQGDDDAFVTKFDRKLTSVLVSTFLGGNKRDAVCSLLMGPGAEIYVAGFTESRDFPTTEGAYDTTYNGTGGYQDDDIFVSKLDKYLSTLMASTFLGGSCTDRCAAIDIDKQGNVFVAGRTFFDSSEVSNNFPTTLGAFDRGFDKSIGSDGILSKLNGDLSKLLASTFLGGSQGKEDRPHALAVDTKGIVYVAGETYSSDFPTTLGSYDECFNGVYDAFVLKLDGNLSTSLPLTTTGDADVLSGTSVKLSGVVNANGLPAKAWMEYGASRGEYDSFSSVNRLSGIKDTPVAFFLDGLLPEVTYYYRLAARNSAGPSYGVEKSFTVNDLPRNKTTIEVTDIAPQEITFGSPVTIRGKINPPPKKSLIYVSFVNEDGLSDSRVISKTNADGSFTLAGYLPPAGGKWVVTAILKADQRYNDIISKPKTFMVEEAEVVLNVAPSSYIISRGGEVDITGEIKIEPNNVTTRNGLLNETLKLVRINPQGGYEDILEVSPYLAGEKMLYKFKCVDLPQTGDWKLLVGLDGSESFESSFTEKINITVEKSEEEETGYAILVEGGSGSGAGRDAHNRTTNDVYQKLLGRGFSDDDIYYFNFNVDQKGVDEKPTEKGVLSAITTWAGAKMTSKPAPLYMVMVGLGANDVFPIDPDVISAGALSEAISALESKLSESRETTEEPIVVIIGANHSGSFIGDISKPNKHRIIITSSDTEEVAYKGPLAPDEDIRQGDYFVSEFFRFAAMDMTVKKSYEAAVREVASFTENANGNDLGGGSAGNGQYFDKVAQHPLLDDNGDGVGSYGVLSSYDGLDGALSSTLMVGKTTGGTLEASDGMPLELTQISDTITLGVENETPICFAKVNDTKRVNTLWMEISSPNHVLDYNAEATEQQVIELPRFGYNYYDESEDKYVWKEYGKEGEFDNFNAGGEYEVFYFGRDEMTGDVTTLRESDVFKGTKGNTAPGEFCMISPLSGGKTAISLVFDWSDSVDADEGDEVEYNLTLSRDADFATIDYEVRGLRHSWALVDKSAGLEDQRPYYWRVLAYEEKGGTRYMDNCSGKLNGIQGIADKVFTPYITSGFPAYLLINVRDANSNAPLVGLIPYVYLPMATQMPPTDEDGDSVFPPLNAGIYTLGLAYQGYKNAFPSVEIYPNKSSYYVLTMKKKL